MLSGDPLRHLGLRLRPFLASPGWLLLVLSIISNTRYLLRFLHTSRCAAVDDATVFRGPFVPRLRLLFTASDLTLPASGSQANRS